MSVSLSQRHPTNGVWRRAAIKMNGTGDVNESAFAIGVYDRARHRKLRSFIAPSSFWLELKAEEELIADSSNNST